jgi:hypothetical protein
MNTFEQIFGDYAATQLRHARWRIIERALIEYFESRHVQIVEISGAPSISIVRHFEAEEAVTAHLSLEEFAQYLAAELNR